METQLEGHDESQEDTQGGEPTETVEESRRETPDDEPMEISEGESEKLPESKGGHDTRSTLTTEEDSELETGEQQQVSTAPLKPIPPLLPLGEPTLVPLSSAHFDPSDPLGLKAMAVATTATFGQRASKGPRGLKSKKWKVMTPFKRLTPAIKLARENACLKLKGSTANGYYRRPPVPKGQDEKKRRWRPGTQSLHEIRTYLKSCNLLI